MRALLMIVALALGGCSSVAPTVAEPELVTVVYKLDGTAAGADITYTDSAGNIQQQTRRAVPLTRNDGADEGIEVRVEAGSFVQFSAQNVGDSGDLACSIEADGRVVNTGHASGGYAIVNCSATV